MDLRPVVLSNRLALLDDSHLVVSRRHSVVGIDHRHGKAPVGSNRSAGADLQFGGIEYNLASFEFLGGSIVGPDHLAFDGVVSGPAAGVKNDDGSQAG